jgi:mono/diheme cytochrome c family protein
MIFRSRIFGCLVFLFWVRALGAAEPAIGPFFEKEQPFFHSQVEVFAPAKGQKTGENFVVRGILLPLASGHCVLFDQELLRVAAIWKVPDGGSPITHATMAQISYASLKKKAGAEHPRPTGPVLVSTEAHVGAAVDLATLRDDPRPAGDFPDAGRGPLPVAIGRFEGTELFGATAVLRYRVGETAVAEWHESRDTDGRVEILRHFEVAPHAREMVFALAAGRDGTARWRSNSAAMVVKNVEKSFVATLAPSERPQRVTVAVSFGADSAVGALPETPALPRKRSGLRWSGTATAPVQRDALVQNGLVLDRIATPDENPWKRRVRAADLAFLTDDRAAVVTYDGDVWLVDGFADAEFGRLRWRRFASGLHESLAVVAPRGVIQVATKNGLVRLHDRDGDGEADWFENFSDLLLQSQTTRSFPLDMATGPDGATILTQGGIVSRSGMAAGGDGTAHTGAIMRISADGRSLQVVGTGAREPYATVHPETGLITATDQQGHYIPSSVCYVVRPGDDFGFLQAQPAKLAPPLVWVPHDQDTSSASELWMIGQGMGAWNGRLLHLSYGTARLFLISPDLDAPVAQGAVIPLDLKTNLPLLHARMNLRGDAVFFAGLQIYGSNASTNWSLGRLRPGKTEITTALAARSCADGVVLEFATPLDPTSLGADKVAARAWNYKRSSAYGSGRYALDGSPGVTPWGVAQTVLSTDRKSVFVHLPKLPAAAQLEVRHDFRLASGAPARGVVYFTIHQPRALDLAAAGFRSVDLTKQPIVAAKVKEEPASAAQGKIVAETFGCAACHSADGTTEGKVGPTWRRLYGAKRTFVDGTTELADELYIRGKILDPQQKPMKAGVIEMPSFRGVLSEQQLESVVLYIKSLAGRPGREE